ncbi:MAG: hypothetical protein JWQ66_2731 [Mucilaginibacter sp.]|nr:hypothetical protein [Mucilaginibacter sp.]
MGTYLHIKRSRLWKICAMILVGIVLACCCTQITSVDQPASATAGTTVPITLHINISCNSSGTANFIMGFLAPNGWVPGKNTTVTYTSSKGSGNMVLVPAGTIAPNSNGLTWPQLLKQKFGNAGNLIDDVSWIVYQTDVPITFNSGDVITGTVDIKTKVASDNNNYSVKLAYVVANSSNGITSDGFQTCGATAEYYNEFIPPSCFEVTGATGDLIDFCNPQLTTVNPPKSLDNDFVTLTFNSNVVTTVLAGAPAVYLCATAYTNDGKTITICSPTGKSMMLPTSTTSGLYQLTFWPRSYFGLTSSQTITKMTYYITDQTGTAQVGYGNTSSPFTYTFKCS